MLRLFDSARSGNCYKVRLLLAQLDRPYERIDVTGVERERRPAELLARHPWGRVPLLVLDDGRALAESDAILWYLGQGTPFLADGPFLQAETLQWMFFEQNNHEPNLAVARYLVSIVRQAERHARRLGGLQRQAREVLRTMERHLAAHPFFVGERYSIADIALFAYTDVAPEGGIALDDYTAVRAWLERVRALPGWVPM